MRFSNVSFAFFAIVIYALSLSEDTRIALYALPIWFLVLGLIYFFKTRNNPYHQKFVEQFSEKVIAQNAAAEKYRARAR